jgi:ferredoxin-NADP reductase
VFAEGPYGAFTTINQQRPDALLVAGGVGSTPIRALPDIAGHVVVLYRVSTPQDAVLLPELRDLAKARGAVVHVLCGPSDQRGPHGALLGAESLDALVPDVDDRDVFVCGPPGMTAAVLRSLRELRVPSTRAHAEGFSLAA